MTKTTSRHLLAEVPDSRILGLAVIAMMCGYRIMLPLPSGDALITLIWRKHSDSHIQRHRVLHYVFKDLDATALENRLTRWATVILEDLTPQTDTHRWQNLMRES